MKQALIEKGIPVLVAALGILLLAGWLRSYTLPSGVKERPLGGVKPSAKGASTPGAQQPTAQAAATTVTNPGATVTDLPGAWPCFRGPNRDNVSPESVALSRDWKAKPPGAYWSVDLGEGYAGPAVLKGRVFVLDYDVAAQADTLRCLSLADGKEVWRRSYPVVVKRSHGMSRTVPAVTEKYVVTLGPKCHVMCCDPTTGQEIWRKDLVAEFGTTVPEWYAGQCPLILGDKVILAPGGKALAIAVDLATGKVVWQTPNPRNWAMTHSSLAEMTVGGQQMVVYCGSGGVAGISTKDGSILWDTTEWVINTATVPTPIPIGDGRVFLCGGYDSGAMMLKVEAAGGKYSTKTLWRVEPGVFGSDQQTPILYKGHIYGVVPGGKLACLSLDGKRLWDSGSEYRFGLGAYAIADGLIYVISDSGVLTMAEANPQAFRPLGQLKVLAGPDAWGPFAIVGGRLLARDLTKMICIDVARH